jgi:taurine dioxygenase
MIYFNPAWVSGIKGFSKEESNAVLSFLKEYMTKPIFQCRVRWQNNSLAFWDNRCVIRSPVPDYMGKRQMQRVTIGTDWGPS